VTAGRLWAYLGIGLPVLAALISNLSTVDLAYHLRAGAMTLDSGVIPRTDSFTFTAAGMPWLNQQWGAQLALALVFRVAGWTGLVLLRATLIGLLTGCLFIICRRQVLGARAAAWLTLGAFVVASVAFTLRPQLFGMLLFAITLLVLTNRRAAPRSLWLVPLIVLVWANVHGSFVLGPLVLGLAWLEDVHERSPTARVTFVAGIAAALATFVNPFGLDVWTYAAGLSTNSFITNQIVEWQPTSLRSAPGVVFFGSVLVVGVILLRLGRPVAWPSLAWLGVFFLIGAYAIRGVAWWPIAAVVVLAGLLARDGRLARRQPPEAPRRLNLAVAATIAIAGLALLPMWRPLDSGLAAPVGVLNYAPSGITGQLRSLVRPGDRIFAPQPWGSWFEFAFPSATVAVDSRIEMFPARVWDDYDEVVGARGQWRERLDGWGVTLVAIRAESEGTLIQELGIDPAWRQAYADRDGFIFARNDRP
jgi:hypothetical protein